jgi:glycosyltransferase involved in cell wall biosynthesis
MINIIVPTAARPAMLRTALQSIANQTAADAIDQVLVSENGGCRKSEEVCREFPRLPITYLFRENPTSAMEHGCLLVKEHLQSELTAFLHDDDWWNPAHLARAIESLAAHPQAGAYGAGHFVVSGESSMLNCSGNLFPWFGSNFAPMTGVWELSRTNVLMAELLGTIAHYSTLVVRTEILRKASYVFDLRNPFDNDRMLNFALSTCAPFVFNPVPEGFVRNHGVQDCFTFDEQKRIDHMCATTRWMVETSGKSWDVVAKSFAKRMSQCPAEAVATLKALSLKPWCVPEMLKHLREPILG